MMLERCYNAVRGVVRFCMRTRLILALLLVDVPLALLLLLLYSPLLLIKKLLRRPTPEHKTILFLSGASSIEECYRKFGNFDLLLHYDGKIEAFDLVQLFWFPAPSKCLRVRLADYYEITQFRGARRSVLIPVAMQVYYFASIILMSDRHTAAVRAFDAYKYGLMGLAVARFLGIPVCVSIHADYMKRESLQPNTITRIWGSLALTLRLEKFVYRHVDRIFPIRDSMIPHVLESGCAREKIRVFAHGIDLSPFLEEPGTDIRSHFGIPEDSAVIAFVGRIERENYASDMLEIALRSVELCPSVYFILCGGGTQRETMLQTVQSCGKEDRILLPGFIKRTLANDLRRQATANLCLMAGFSLIEACASGRPVVAYDVEWHYELIQNGETGYLVAENDIDKVTEIITGICSDPESKQLERLGRNARERAFARHKLSVTSETKNRLYRELLEV